MKSFTEQDLHRAQEAWARGIVEIGREFIQGGRYRDRALELLDSLYGFAQGPVLFKPTRASRSPFRLDREAALSYFVGGNPDYPEDRGFALQPWVRVRFANAACLIRPDHALAMGHYFFTTTSGEEIMVEYSFGYFKDQEGRTRIHLHHSSLPFREREEA